MSMGSGEIQTPSGFSIRSVTSDVFRMYGRVMFLLFSFTFLLLGMQELIKPFGYPFSIVLLCCSVCWVTGIGCTRSSLGDILGDWCFNSVYS